MDGNARHDRSDLIRKEYANDLGFLHAEQAVNLVAIYQVMETKYKLVKKKKWYGYSKYKQVEYEEEWQAFENAVVDEIKLNTNSRGQLLALLNPFSWLLTK